MIIELHSTIVTLGLACLTTNGLIKDNSNISSGVAKTLIGLKPLVNCPWLHEAVSIVAYTFFVERNRVKIFVEDNTNLKLSPKTLNILQNVKQGDIIIFNPVKVKCPGDDNYPRLDLKLIVN